MTLLLMTKFARSNDIAAFIGSLVELLDVCVINCSVMVSEKSISNNELGCNQCAAPDPVEEMSNNVTIK